MVTPLSLDMSDGISGVGKQLRRSAMNNNDDLWRDFCPLYMSRCRALDLPIAV
jgi:hypothetical protein